ncbi:hypothetical protein ACLOJK_025367 [Asimina triloba]
MQHDMAHVDLWHATSNIVSLARSGAIAAARRLFDEMPQRDVVVWNAMLTSYSQLSLSQEALCLFSDMRIAGMKPDAFSFTAALHAVAHVGIPSNGRKFHALTVSFGLQSSLPVCNSLIDMYGKCSSPSDAARVFDEMGPRNEVSWCSLLSSYAKAGQFEYAHALLEAMPVRNHAAYNALIAGYSQYGDMKMCMQLFKTMKVAGFGWDLWTFASMMNACAELCESFYGHVIRACIVKSGWSWAVEVNNATLSFFAKLNCHKEAAKFFELIENKTLVSWNAMVDAHMKSGDVQAALAAFQQAPEKNVVTWTTMIRGFVRNGQGELALCFFVNMQRNFQQPDDYTLGATLHACANLAILRHGKMVHSCVILHGFHSYKYTSNGLINMYAKSGDIDGSIRIFNAMLDKDLVSWNAMLFGLGLHGQAKEALKLFDHMAALKVKPDRVTFIGLLMACGHSGLVEEGWMLFESMESVHGLAHGADHVSCIVDMLGRGKYLEEATKLVSKSSMLSPNAKHFETLLGACSFHGDVAIGSKMAEELTAMYPFKDAGYVLLSNLYCASGHWKEAERVRMAMSAKAFSQNDVTSREH